MERTTLHVGLLTLMVQYGFMMGSKEMHVYKRVSVKMGGIYVEGKKLYV